jgi:hypothetical protein
LYILQNYSLKITAEKSGLLTESLGFLRFLRVFDFCAIFKIFGVNLHSGSTGKIGIVEDF